MTAEAARPPGTAHVRIDRRLLVAGFLTGLAYGLVFRAMFGHHALDRLFGVMSLGFIFVVPFAMGYLTVWMGERTAPWPWGFVLFVPPLTALVTLTAALLLAWEGLICIVLWVPLVTVMALLGGLTAGIIGRLVRWRAARATVVCVVALLPMAVSPAERLRGLPDEVRAVHTSIDIAADPITVWRAIVRVRRFEAPEHGFAWTHAMGFPRPVEATLDREGVGGIRHATFEGGVLFVERITAWEPQRRLAFTVHADPNAIPMRTLDEHVTVGGEYFDVLDGEYLVEPLANGRVRLHLTSHHRLSTRFNLYSRLWTDFVMRDVQQYILARLRVRCESGRP